jgi:hypothetical protein
MSRRTTTALALPLLLALALAACTPSGGAGDDDEDLSPASSDEPSSDELGPVLTSCVNGDWTADLDDLVRQLGDTLAGTGMSITATTASGSQNVSIGGEGVIGFSSDATLEITADTGNGVTMTVSQHHVGTMAADWAWDGSAEASDTGGTMLFENFDSSSYAIHNTTEVGGQVSESDIPVSEAGYGDVPMHVTCSGDTMTTQAEGSPFTTRWQRD